MKQVRAWLNEKQYKDYVKAAKKIGLTEYGTTKKLVVDFIEQKQWEEKKMLTLYFFVLYSMVATALLLVF